MGKSQQRWDRRRSVVSKVRENDVRQKHPCCRQAGWRCVEIVPGAGCKWLHYHNKVCLSWLDNECTKTCCLFMHQLQAKDEPKKRRIRKRKPKKNPVLFSLTKGTSSSLPPPHLFSIPVTSLVVENGVKKAVVTLGHILDLNTYSVVSPIDVASNSISLSNESLLLSTYHGSGGVTFGNHSGHPSHPVHTRFSDGSQTTVPLSVQPAAGGGWLPTPSPESAALFNWVFLDLPTSPHCITNSNRTPAILKTLRDATSLRGWEYEAMLNIEITITKWRELCLLELSKKCIPFRYRSVIDMKADNELSTRATPAVYVRSFAAAVVSELVSHWLGDSNQRRHNATIMMKALDSLLQGNPSDTVPTFPFITELHTSGLTWIPNTVPVGTEGQSHRQALRARLVGRFFHFAIAHIMVPVLREYFPAQREDGHSILHYHVFIYRRLWKMLLLSTPGYTQVPIPLQTTISDFIETIKTDGPVSDLLSHLQRILNDSCLDGCLHAQVKNIISTLLSKGVSGMHENRFAINCIIKGILQCSDDDVMNYETQEGHIILLPTKTKTKKKSYKILSSKIPFQLRVKRSGGPRWARVIWKCGISPYTVKYCSDLQWQHRIAKLKRQHVVVRTTRGRGPSFSLHRLKPWLIQMIKPHNFSDKVSTKSVCYKQHDSGTATLEVQSSPNTAITNLLLRSYSGGMVRDELPLLAALQLLKKGQKVIAPHGFYLAHLDASQAYDAITHTACTDAVQELSTSTTTSQYLDLLKSIIKGRTSGIPQGWVLAEHICNIVQRDRVLPTATFFTRDEYPPFVAHIADDVLIVTFSQESLDQITTMLSRPDMLHGVIPNFLKSEVATPQLPGTVVTFNGRCINPSLEVFPSLRKYCKTPMWKRVSLFPSYTNRQDVPNEHITLDVQSGFVDEGTLLASVADHKNRKFRQVKAMAPLLFRLPTYPLLFVKGHLSEWFFDLRLNGVVRRKKTFLCAAIVGWMTFYALLGKGLQRPRTSEPAVSLAAQRFRTRLAALLSARVSRSAVDPVCAKYLMLISNLLVSSHAMTSVRPSDSFYHLSLSLYHHQITSFENTKLLSHSSHCKSCSVAVRKQTWDLLIRSGMEAWVVPEMGFRDTLPSGRLMHLINRDAASNEDDDSSEATADVV
eukprot:TRINITY_DN6247_c0_g1_i1.p1 TRINITY_DN6247_c0_g1~~TRINITY_DN6247_c0_g1_i1.p1  ORF type:complete len:1139 (+),score=163.52 TRINITY_DN6247_c0_g1_i1:68-3484(+)